MASEKTYISDIPHLMEEWNWEKNIEFDPNQLTAGSHKKVWWMCMKGHEWQATIKDRNRDRGCPVCSGKQVLNGYNDLLTTNPKLSAEWNCEKNVDLTPCMITSGSNKKVWWKCEKGHEWQAIIKNRNKGIGCPICSGQEVFKGYNDLLTVNPELSAEWNYEKNIDLKPNMVTSNSGKKVWWKCKKEHEWQATVSDRNHGKGCPICSSERKTSFPEYAIEYYLKKYDIKAIHLYQEKGYELDIFIPSKKVAIEYDGYLWHKNKEKKDIEKNRKCEKDKIKLYRIREGLPSLNDSSIDYVIQKNQKDLNIILEKLLREIIGMDIDVNITRDNIAIENLRDFMEKETSLLFCNPEIASEWNFEKNGKLKPEYFTANSSKKVWWKCSKGHEWQVSIDSRNNGHGCPYCAGRKVFKGDNDLQTVNPNLAKSWNYEKNIGLTPMDITPNSNKKVWWKCDKGHEWQARIDHRNNGSGCPYCFGRYAIRGENDLQTVNPTLAKEWNYEKNGNITPDILAPNSNKKVWWKCEKGHEWQAIVANRNKGRGCPQCAKEKRKVTSYK